MNNTQNNTAAVALRDLDDPRLAKLDEAARKAALIRPDSGNPFTDALRTANCMAAIRATLTPEVMEPIMRLQNSRLGFKTDRVREGGYPVGIVKDAIIEAIVNGVPLIGNCFNIIGENFYLTREGVTFKLNHFPGLRYQIIPGCPKTTRECEWFKDERTGKQKAVPGEASVKVRVEWDLNGETGAQDLEFAVRVNYGMQTDAIVGKAFCRAAKWLHARVTGLDIGVTEGTDEPKNITPPPDTTQTDKPKSSKLRDALGIPPETPIEEATFAPGGDPAPANAVSAAGDTQEAAPPPVNEEIPGLDD